MLYARSSAASAVWNGKLIICGGRDHENKVLKSVECFDPDSGVWRKLNDMPIALSGHTMVSYEDKLTVVGISEVTALSVMLEMNPREENGRWKELPSTNNCNAIFTAVALQNEIFAMGGRDEKEDRCQVEIYDGEKWRNGPPLPYIRCTTPSIVIPQYFADTLCNYCNVA